jgi:hypothetical protein
MLIGPPKPEVLIEEPDKVSPPAIGQEELFRSATPTLLRLGGITQISEKNNIDSETKGR